MVKRTVTDGKPPRDFVDRCFLKLRDIVPVEPSGRGRYGVSLKILADMIYPPDSMAEKKEFVKKIASSPGRNLGSNMRRIRYAMEEIGFIVIPVVKDIKASHPHWESQDFVTMPSDFGLICGENRAGEGFLFASVERRGARMLAEQFLIRNQRTADALQARLRNQRHMLHLVSDTLENQEREDDDRMVS
jgi:hypothetical protein